MLEEFYSMQFQGSDKGSDHTSFFNIRVYINLWIRKDLHNNSKGLTVRCALRKIIITLNIGSIDFDFEREKHE